MRLLGFLCVFLLKSADAVWVNTSVFDWAICQHIFDLVQGLRNVTEISKDSDISLSYLSLSKPNDSDSTENGDRLSLDFQFRDIYSLIYLLLIITYNKTIKGAIFRQFIHKWVTILKIF